MNHGIINYFAVFALLLSPFVAANVTAQTTAYRQTNLASNLPNVANEIAPQLVDPWGIAFLPDQQFFIADNHVGRVTVLAASGVGAGPNGFIVPSATGTGFDTPTGIVADQDSFFGGPFLVKPFIIVTDQGTVFTWGPDAHGNLPPAATLQVDHTSSGAVYQGVAILNSSTAAPALAITDFHGGFIETFLPGFVPMALRGSFTDPNLPPGFAPFGIQVIGREVFITYAVQDTTKHNAVFGSGNGIISIFDFDGNFVRRFATGGALNAPWGIAQAAANFGPFSNDILVGNVGDGKINAFDPATGHLVGALTDGDGSELSEVGLHGMAFRADRVGDPNSLYFTSQLRHENDGLFGAISPGLVSITSVSAPETAADAAVTITAAVTPGPHNQGAPAGTVTFLEGSKLLQIVALVDGSAALDTFFAEVGVHQITARYSGDATFLPSSATIPLQVAELATTTNLTVPATAPPGSPVTFSATVNSPGGIPTGQVAFHDGNANLGTSSLNASGVAILRDNTLSPGVHSLTAVYAGDGKFAASVSREVTINIVSPDFSLTATPASATVAAGQSTQFMLNITPASGFANNVTLSCSAVAGITCTFNPSTVTPAGGVASTTLTVNTSANVSHFGILALDLIRLGSLLATSAAFSFLVWWDGKTRNTRTSLLATTAAIVGLSLMLGGCGGYGGASQTNRRTASIVVTAQSGSVSHSTTVKVTVQ